jgi:hypothetical protein
MYYVKSQVSTARHKHGTNTARHGTAQNEYLEEIDNTTEDFEQRKMLGLDTHGIRISGYGSREPGGRSREPGTGWRVPGAEAFPGHTRASQINILGFFIQKT